MNTPALILMSLLTPLLNWFNGNKLEHRSASAYLSDRDRMMQLVGMPSRNGTIVNIDTTIGIPALWGAYRIISESIASLPIEVFERRDDGNFPAESLNIRKLLRVEPNEMYSAYDLKIINVLDLAQTGNYFNRIYRNKYTSDIDELVRLAPSDVYVLYDYANRRIKYEVHGRDIIGTQKIEILAHDDIEHVKIMSKDGVMGRSPISACADAFATALSSQGYISDFMGNSAHLTGILSSKTNLNEKQQKDAWDAWNNHTSKNKGGTAVLGADFTYTRISATPAEAEYAAIAQLTDKQINQIFRIPAHINGDLSRSTNNNIEQQDSDFLMHTLRPLLKAIENEKNRKYWLTDKKREKYFVDFNMDAMLRADTEARAAFYNTMITLGIMSINEVRELEKKNKIKDGDKHRVQMNMIDLDQTGQQNPPKNEQQ